MLRWIQKHLFSLIFGLIGAIFLLVGLVILWFGFLSNRQIDAQMHRADLGVGDVIGIKKKEETATYVDGETGEENEYHLFEVREL